MKSIVLIPTYNNAPSIGSIVSKCKKVGFQVVVVNDGSTDGSEQAAREAGAEVLSFKKNRGKGAALQRCSAFIGAQERDVTITVRTIRWREIIPRMFPFIDRLLSLAR